MGMPKWTGTAMLALAVAVIFFFPNVLSYIMIFAAGIAIGYILP